MVTVAVTDCVSEIVADCVVEHVGTSAAPEGFEVTAQLRATLPVNPPAGVIVIVEVPLVPGDAMVTAVPLNVKDAGAADPVTVMATFAVSVIDPAAPVIVAV